MSMPVRRIDCNLAGLLASLLGATLYGGGNLGLESPEQRAARILRMRERRDEEEHHQRAVAQRAAADYESKAAPIREERLRRKRIAFANRLPKADRAAALAALKEDVSRP